jgi:glycosyltransferase involved in cell wall biosynthesis/SAM-dependent methyltransferase
MPLEDGHADVVVCFETIEHLDDQAAFVGELVRILRPEGLLILSTPDRRAFAGLEANPFHVRELDCRELTELLERHFGWVAVGGQRSDAGSTIAFPEAVQSRQAASFFDRAGASTFHGSAELPAPVYLIALATNGPPPDAGPSTLFDSQYLPRIHGRLQELERIAPANREELLATYLREQALAAHVAGVGLRIGQLADEFGRLTDELASFSPEVGTPPAELATAETVSARAVLFLSGCPGDSYRYRCEHQAVGLSLAGGTADSAAVGSIDLDRAYGRYAAFVLHRVAWDEAIERLVTRARADGKPVIFDSDDLVFEPDALPFVAALSGVDELERNAFADNVARCRRTLLEAGAASVSTEALHDAATRAVGSVVTIPNAVSDAMVRGAREARAAQGAGSTAEVVVAYLSGTPTHDRDFLEAADAVLWALETHEHVRFMAAGHLRLDERFDDVAARVERIPFQPWQEVSRLLARVDVNLAPLEPENPFTEAKSCLKYLEAALLGLPTIASPRRDFSRVIRHGENGLLADTPDEWREALGLLIESPERRASIGEQAFDDVHRNRTVRARARAQHVALASLAGRGGDRLLVVNWVVRAPIAATDRSRTVFRLANALAARGHRVRLYVQWPANVEPLADRETAAFARSEFGPIEFELVVGSDAMGPADVSIATSWLTAPTVAAHRGSLFKALFVQEYEPDLYAEDDPVRAEAESAYALPLRHIAHGRGLAERMGERTGVASDWLDAGTEADSAALERILAELAFVRLDAQHPS